MNIKRKNEKYLNLITVFALCFSLVISFVIEGFTASDEVRDNCLRLHILADSDSDEAQKVKLLVRDAVLEAGAELFEKNTDAAEAAEKILSNKEMLEETADRVLRENGFSYKATLSVTEEYFDTRQYEDIRLPAGRYRACRIVLGEGKGKNWWCIMFPPLCLPAVTENTEDAYAVFGEGGAELVTENSGYVIKFRIVEIVEELREKIMDAIKEREESKSTCS